MEQVTYEDIRGTKIGGFDWPNDGYKVSEGSFMGKLRIRTGGGILFDLPKEAQWEYACRAGTQTYYSDNLGTPLSAPSNAQMNVLGRYNQNGGKYWTGSAWATPPGTYDANNGSAIVGSYLPNPWGLYDVHGNVYEFCLDWYDAILSGGTDPVGSTSGTDRVFRGGEWNDSATACRSAFRAYRAPNSGYLGIGLRVVAHAISFEE